MCRALLRIENDRLSVAQIGIFGAKKWDWNREGIAAIRADASGMTVNLAAKERKDRKELNRRWTRMNADEVGQRFQPAWARERKQASKQERGPLCPRELEPRDMRTGLNAEAQRRED